METENNAPTSSAPSVDFSSVVERILSTVEQRRENPSSSSTSTSTSLLFLTANELQALSGLCATQSSMLQQQQQHQQPHQQSLLFNNDDDLGFADVDPEWIGQLVGILEKHVVAAGNINVIQQAYDVASKHFRDNNNDNGDNGHKKKKQKKMVDEADDNDEDHLTLEEWIYHKGKTSIAAIKEGLEAASILLFIITSPGMNRSVVSEDAIQASIVLFRHNLIKNILPMTNEIGHIVAAMPSNTSSGGSAAGIATTTSTPKKRRRSNSTSTSTAASSSGKNRKRQVGGIDVEMKKIYPYISQTMVPTIAVMERLDALVQKIPLDDQELLLIVSGALTTLELLDNVVVSKRQQVHLLQVSAINLVTSIFRLHSRLRQIILEDLFPLMRKLPTSKRSLRTYPIRGSSVLYPSGLLDLSQSIVSATTTTTTTLDPTQNIQTMTVLIISLIQSAVARPTTEMPSGLAHSQAISDFFVQQLLQRCAKKGEDGGASEFRPLLSNLMDDLFLVLLVPEYPAAEMVLLSMANHIGQDLMKATWNKASNKSSSSSSSSEPAYLNTIFDAFGRICAAEARILKFARDRPFFHRNKTTTTTTAVTNPSSNNKNTTTTTTKNVHNCYCSEDVASNNDNRLMLSCDGCNSWFHGDCVGLKKESIPNEWYCDVCQLKRIVDLERDRNTNLGAMGCSVALIDETYCMQRLLIDYLSIVARATAAEKGMQDAYGFQLARWIAELNASNSSNSNRGDINEKKAKTTSSTLPITTETLEGAAATMTENGSVLPSEENSNVSGMSALILRLMELWDPNESSDINQVESKSLNGMLHCLSDEGRSRMVVHVISKQSVLLMSFRRQIDLIVKLMSNDTSSLLRKLSLKAIEKVTDADQQLMIYSFMKKAVTNRFSDEAISVREAAVSLVGSYVVSSPAVANTFHAAFMVGLNDAGLSVRKRTIKILEDILCSNPNYKGRAAACGEMLRLAADPKEDDGVRDLIHAVFMKLWLDKGDQSVPQLSVETPSPTVPKTPLSTTYVQCVEEQPLLNGNKTTAPATPSSGVGELLATPMTRETRSTERRTRRKRLQIRSEIAAEQMVEVVKAANTGEHLTALFRELLYSARDAGTSRKTTQRKKQKLIAQDHCSMLVDALLELLLSFEEHRSDVKNPGKQLVAIMRCIKVFTDVSVDSVVKHLDTLLPYMKADNGLDGQDEEVVVSSLSDILCKMANVLDQEDIERLSRSFLADSLVNVTYKLGRSAHTSAAHALCVLAHHKYSNPQSLFRQSLLKIANVFYKVLYKHQDATEFSSQKPRIKANVQRSMSVLGSICQHHEIALKEDDEMDEDKDSDGPVMKQITWENLTSLCKEMFMIYLDKDDNQTQCVALRAMCGVFIAHPRELLRMNQVGMISKVMSTESPPSLQIEALQCWREILLAEEARIDNGEAKAKMDSKKSITLSKRISGDQDGDATLFGGVLTSHAPRLFQMTQVKDKTLRFAALDLIGHLLRQGQVNPNETVPFLLALQGDIEEDRIRSLALKLLMIEGEKRPDMLRQRVCAGVKQAYLFQKSVYPEKEEVSALVKVNRHGSLHTECVFGRVFTECILSIKKQRHGLFRNLLSLFDLQSRLDSFETTTSTKKRKQSKSSNQSNATFLEDLPMLSFTSQVLAYLPYTAASDPLYIIHNISSSLALRGPDLLDRLANFLRPYGFSSGDDDMEDTNIEEDALEIAAKRNRPQHAKEVTRLLEPDFDVAQFSELCAESGALTLLLRLKTFLRKAYNLSEARCIAYSPEDKERVVERAVSKAASMKFNTRLAMVTVEPMEMSELDGMIFQYSEFRRLMRIETSMETKFDEEEDDDSEGEEEGSNKKQRLNNDPL